MCGNIRVWNALLAGSSYSVWLLGYQSGDVTEVTGPDQTTDDAGWLGRHAVTGITIDACAASL